MNSIFKHQTWINFYKRIFPKFQFFSNKRYFNVTATHHPVFLSFLVNSHLKFQPTPALNRHKYRGIKGRGNSKKREAPIILHISMPLLKFISPFRQTDFSGRYIRNTRVAFSALPCLLNFYSASSARTQDNFISSTREPPEARNPLKLFILKNSPHTFK